ncbi:MULTISPECIES: glycerate kinase [unclassified Sporosarcina]|uniref:glycerate kinase n=1 Tax=unclassified Sporosarcina TaxID=2647733 RepID=UPI00203E6F49|nr:MULTISPECIES: glycerate kinase [unclassified Sporosarcina]GKV65180.1 glycerate kinase [Sporosarcina sp. NCCP-2331]GLB55304.1 glycerate kinase [Sporosarcina sp. NCCP-2378]
MKILIAPDAFKGSLTANEAATAMRAGVERAMPEAETICLPVADGGEGTMAALVSATDGNVKTLTVNDPLGRQTEAQLGILGDGETTVIELAQASGLLLLAPDELNPMHASTYGTGQLIRQALDDGYRKLIIGLGGSATNDGGTGLLEALGVKFSDADGNLLQMKGSALRQIAGIDCSQLDGRLKTADIRIASDVQNPFVGENGASSIFGPQKGADEQMVKALDDGLHHFADLTEQQTGMRLHDYPGAGAAGGSAGALLAYCGAHLESGIEVVLEMAGFAQHLTSADFILTGEGRTDLQTLQGKALMGIAKTAKANEVPVAVISGSIEEQARPFLKQWFSVLCALDESGYPAAELMTDAANHLAATTAELMQNLPAAFQ